MGYGTGIRITGNLWGESIGHLWFPSQRPMTRSFDIFFDLCLNKRLNKQSRRRRFGTPLCSLWRHCNVFDEAWLLGPGGRFKNTYELLNVRALKFSPVNRIHIFQCMGKIFCVEFQRYPLKFRTKYLTHTLKDVIFIQHWNFKSSYM